LRPGILPVINKCVVKCVTFLEPRIKSFFLTFGGENLTRDRIQNDDPFLSFEMIIAHLIKSVNVEIGPKSGTRRDVGVKT